MASARATSGCAFFKSLVGRNYVDLENADVQAMSVDIRKEQKTVCPRERVQMAVFLKAKLDGEEAYVEYQTWQGDENRNDKLDFEPFNFHANLGSFDEEGYFSPNRDLLKSIERDFVIHTVRPVLVLLTSAGAYWLADSLNSLSMAVIPSLSNSTR